MNNTITPFTGTETHIKLLDGSRWLKEDLIKEMRDDSFYYGYLKTAAMSTSSAKYLLSSPKEYYREMTFHLRKDLRGEEKPSPALLVGGLVDAMLLDPDALPMYVKSSVDSRNTKTYREQEEPIAKEKGQKLLLKSEWATAERCVDALNRNEFFLESTAGMQPQEPIIGYAGMEEDKYLPWRAKADIITPEGKLIDLKTTSSLNGFHVSANKYNYDLQAVLYSKLFDKDPHDFRFIVVDKKTLDVGVFTCSPAFVARGEAKLRKVVETYLAWFPKSILDPEVPHNLDTYYLIDEL